MPITFELRENNQVFYWEFTDPWSFADLIPLSKQVRVQFEETNHKIHTLAVLHRARHLPSNLLRIRELGTWDHPKSGQLVIVGAPAFGKSIMGVIGRMVKFDRMHFSESEEDAWAFLRQAIAQDKGQ